MCKSPDLKRLMILSLFLLKTIPEHNDECYQSWIYISSFDPNFHFLSIFLGFFAQFFLYLKVVHLQYFKVFCYLNLHFLITSKTFIRKIQNFPFRIHSPWHHFLNKQNTKVIYIDQLVSHISQFIWIKRWSFDLSIIYL